MPANTKVNNGQRVLHGSDEELFVTFYKNALSGKDHVKIRFPGDKHSTYDQPVKEKDKRRFAHAWDAYENQLERFPGQTRLEEVAWVDEATRLSLQAAGVFTVEQLAAVTDGNLEGIGMGARGLRAKAQQEAARTAAAKKVGEIDQEKAAMAARVAELENKLQTLTRGVSQRDGRNAKPKGPEAA
jgi:hypothetical protein